MKCVNIKLIFYTWKEMKENIIVKNYIFISGQIKNLKKFGSDGDDFIFRSPKSLFEFLEKIDFSAYELLSCAKTTDLRDIIIKDYGMTIEQAVSYQTKIFYVETKFEMGNKMMMKYYRAAIFGKEFYYCARSRKSEKKMTFIIVFSHGICVHCFVDIYKETDFNKIRRKIDIHYPPLRYFSEHVKNIIMDNLKCAM